MEKQEGEHESRLDKALLGKIRTKFAEELEKKAAQSKTWAAFLGPDIGEKIICGEAAPTTFGTEELLIKIAGELGLSEKEIIGELKSALLKER